jgi:hypothetical protein
MEIEVRSSLAIGVRTSISAWSTTLYTSERSRNDEGLVYNAAQNLAPFKDEPADTIPPMRGRFASTT